MWLMLPEEGGLPEELLNSGEVVRFLLNQEIWENSTYPMVDLIIPKMNITSDLDLRQELQALGVTDVFDAQVSDFYTDDGTEEWNLHWRGQLCDPGSGR